MKLFLYSFAFSFSDQQSGELAHLVGKKPEDITIAVIDNAADIIPDSASWVVEARNTLTDKGYAVKVIDLRVWKGVPDEQAIRKEFAGTDVVWIGGGNTFYVRWLLRQSGADTIIIDLVKAGIVYAGWSAGAIIAGPTLNCIEHMEDTNGVPELIREGLGLTDIVVVPHMDNVEFKQSALKTNEALIEAGYLTQPLTDSQALVIDGELKKVL